MHQEIPPNVRIIWLLGGVSICEINSRINGNDGVGRIEYLARADESQLSDEVYDRFLWATFQLARQHPDKTWTCWLQDNEYEVKETQYNAPYRIGDDGKFHKTIRYEDGDSGIIYESDMGGSPHGFVTGPLPEVDLADLEEYKINYPKRPPKIKKLQTTQKSAVSIPDPVSEEIKSLVVSVQPTTIETSIGVAVSEQKKTKAEKPEKKDNVTHETVLDPKLTNLLFALFILNKKHNSGRGRRRQRLPGYPNEVILYDRENDGKNHLGKGVPIWRSSLFHRTTYK